MVTHVRNFANDLIQLAIVGLQVARNNGEGIHHLEELIVKEKGEHKKLKIQK